jgi:hypothetical protein
VEEHLLSRGHEIVRSKLYVGDISLLHNQSVCIDLKGLGMKEVYSNLVQQHDRFKAEAIRARDAHIKLVILVENDGIKSLDDVINWKNPRAIQYAELALAHAHGKLLQKKLPSRPPVSSKRLMNMMRVMALKYGIEWQFCTKAEAGMRVEQILIGGGEYG